MNELEQQDIDQNQNQQPNTVKAEKSVKSIIIKYAVTFAVGLVISLFVMSIRGIFEATDTKEIYRTLCDGTFATAGLMVCVGLLILCTNLGSFTSLGHIFQNTARVFVPGKKGEYQSYGKYVEKAEQKPKASFVHLLLTGAVFALISIIFYIIYSNQ